MKYADVKSKIEEIARESGAYFQGMIGGKTDADGNRIRTIPLVAYNLKLSTIHIDSAPIPEPMIDKIKDEISPDITFINEKPKYMAWYQHLVNKDIIKLEHVSPIYPFYKDVEEHKESQLHTHRRIVNSWIAWELEGHPTGNDNVHRYYIPSRLCEDNIPTTNWHIRVVIPSHLCKK